MVNFNKYTVLFLSFTLFFIFGMQAQNEDIQVPDSAQVVSQAISIGNIPIETEKLGQRIIELRKILKPSAKIGEVDSLLNIASVEINNKKDSLRLELEGLTRRVLKVRKVEWDNYHTILKGHQNLLKDRTEDISEITDELSTEIEKWVQTKKILVDNSESKDLYDGLDEILGTLQKIMKNAHTRVDSVYIVQNKLTEMVLTVDETISEIELVQLQMQKDYFVFDSEPIWKLQNKRISVVDTTKTDTLSATRLIISGLQENKEQMQEFLSLNVKTAIMQLFFILILLTLMIRVNNKWKKDLTDLSNPIERQAKIVLSYPLSATVVVGVLISAFFYDALIPAFAEFHIILILIGTVVLLPKLTNKRFRLFLLLIFFVYLMHTFEAYLGPKVTMVRWLMVLDALILTIAFILGRKVIVKFPEQFQQIYRIFKIVTPFYILILVGAIVANIIGMASLSRFLITGVMTSTVLGMVVYLSVKVIISLIVLFFKFRKSYSIQALSSIVNATHNRIQPILNWIGMLFWLMFTLSGFDILDFIVRWINELMLMNWEIGEMTISLGGILAFLGIFVITIIIAKIGASIFQDEWMINVLPRGIAPAISLVLRIVVISIGLYIALTAAGLDLSKLGFMLGALGVGIGFGLQNVVLNFISGLILAFERPINLGDTIEVDQEFGIVTNIGVRSSNIKSYSGYEAIIPNGDLISKKVINYTLSNRNRRSKIYMKTAPNADPEKVIELFNKVAAENPKTHKNPAPKTYFYGYDEEGSLSFALLYWTTFTDTLKTDSAIALKIFASLKEEGIQAPAPVRRIISEK